jgi:hypothetical protein
VPARDEVGAVLDDVGVPGQLPQQLDTAGALCRLHWHQVRVGQQHGVVEGQLPDEELPGRPLVVLQDGAAALQEALTVPDLVLDRSRGAGQHGGVHGRWLLQVPAQGVDHHRGRDRRGQGQDHVLLPGGEQAFEGRHDVQPGRAAGARMLQHRLPALRRCPGPEDPARDHTALQQVVDHHHGGREGIGE